MDAERTSLERGDPSDFVRERRVARRAKRHLKREYGRAAEVDRIGHEVAAANAKPGPSLEIGTEQ
jgi:IS5 family transposase